MEWLSEQIQVFGIPVRLSLLAGLAAVAAIVLAAILAAAFRPGRRNV